MLLTSAEQVPPQQIKRTSGHILALDGIRGAAAAMVFIYHYGGGAHSSNSAIHFLGESIHLGWAGVSLFFVLSGFLITGILLNSMQGLKWRRTFYLRRSLRIFPIYYGSLIVVVLVNVLLRTPWSAVFPIWPLFFYLQGFPGFVRLDAISPFIVVGHLWSLAVEEQFYLIWPLLLFSAMKRGYLKQLCVAVFFVSFVFRVCIFYLHLNTEWAVYSLAGRAGEMAAGGFLAMLLRSSDIEKRCILRNAKWAIFASCAGLLFLLLATKEIGPRGPWMGTLGIALLTQLFTGLIALCVQPGFTARIFSFSGLRWLGKISYGIYVFHLLFYPAFAWFAHQLMPASYGKRYLLLLAVVALLGTLSAAWISFNTVESWFLRLKDSLGKPQSASREGVV